MTRNLGDLAVSIVTAGRSPAYQLQVDPQLCPELMGMQLEDMQCAGNSGE